MMKMKEFYRNYFNFNYCRDLRVVYPPNKIRQPSPKVLHNYNYPKTTTDLEMSERFFSFLLNNKNRNGVGNTYYEITNYKYLSNYRNKTEPYTDRLFFDFDIEGNDEIATVKKELYTIRTTLSGKERIKAEDKLRTHFRDILLNTDALKTPFFEAIKLNNYFNELGIKTLLLFSGSKGLALNVLFDNLQLENISQISYELAVNLKKGLNLSTLDLAVNKDAKARMQRVPYTKHNYTLLVNQPIPQEVGFDEFLDIIKNTKPRVMDLNIMDYENYYIKDLLLKKDFMFKVKNTKVEARRKFNGTYKPDNNKDCRDLCKQVLGEPVREYKEYNTYLCPFHEDNIPSARVYKDNFYCAACGAYYWYDDLIKMLK